MVPAHGADDVPWAGRDRGDEASRPAVPFEVQTGGEFVRLATPAVTLTIRLTPLALTWALPDETEFARDGDPHAYMFGTRAVRRACARDPATPISARRQDRAASTCTGIPCARR
jgi:hypothetical protein